MSFPRILRAPRLHGFGRPNICYFVWNVLETAVRAFAILRYRISQVWKGESRTEHPIPSAVRRLYNLPLDSISDPLSATKHIQYTTSPIALTFGEVVSNKAAFNAFRLKEGHYQSCRENSTRRPFGIYDPIH